MKHVNMFGKHTAICQLVSPIVMIFLHITLQYYQQRDLLSSLSVSVSLPIFPPYFAGLPSHVFLLRLKNRVWREEGGGREDIFEIILLALRLN